jgi:hypothetical protein
MKLRSFKALLISILNNAISERSEVIQNLPINYTTMKGTAFYLRSFEIAKAI